MKKKSQQMIALALIVAILGVSIYFIGDYAGLWAASPSTTPTTKLTSTFTLIDYNTGEDVSEWVEISVWTPDPDDIPFDSDEDPYRLANFDEDVTSQDAADVTIDLRSHSVAWLEIDPDHESDYGGYAGVFAAPTVDDYRQLTGGANYDYTFYVYHEPSDVDIDILDRNRGLGHWNVSRIIQLLTVRTDDINGTIVLNLPWNSTAGIHAGEVGNDGWDIDDDELDDMIADFDPVTLRYGDELEWLYSQNNFRTIAPFYDPADDTLKDYDSDLEKLTNAFVIDFTFNATINMTDQHDAFTDDAQVNFTIYERDWKSLDVEILRSGAHLYVIFLSPFTCYPGGFSFDFEMVLGDSINVSAVETGRMVIPRDENNLGAFTAYSAAHLFNFLNHPMW
jgi:hypothetical protein